MDELVSADPALYDPTSFGTLADQFLSGSSPTSPPPGGAPIPPTPSLSFDPSLPGLGSITELLQVVALTLGSIETGVKHALAQGLGPALAGILAVSERIAPFLAPPGLSAPPGAQQLGTGLASTTPGALWQWVTDHSIGQVFTEMLELGLAVDTSQFDAEATKGRQTVDTMLGFAFLSQFVIPCIGLLGKLIFANRWVDAALEPLAKIPEEMGLSWAMGLTIDEAFKTAVGRSIEEGINRQKRGNRLEWPQLRTMLKQHIFEGLTIDQHGTVSGTIAPTTTAKGEEVLRGLLENQGYPDKQIDMLMALSDSLLPVGDLQQLYLRGEMSIEDVTAYVTKLGFNDTDRDRLVKLYVSKAETEASTTLRTTARELYVNQLIGETQYRDILSQANYPQLEIDADVQAVQLVQTYGRLQATISTIKQRLMHHQISPQEAVTELHRLNLANDYITDLIQLWQAAPAPRPHGLTQAQVLRYLVSGLLTPTDAYNRLIELGVDQADATFLVAHPSASNAVHQYRLTPGLVTQAYIDGAIAQTDLPAMFQKVGVAADAIDSYVQAALYKKAHHRGTDTYSQTLPENKVIEAYKFGIFDGPTTVERLQQMGFSQADAMVLMEIENKGVFGPPPVQYFPDLFAAEFYLEGLGYNIVPPPDPRIAAAEQMLAAAGYTWVAPLVPAPGPIGGGGGPLP